MTTANQRKIFIPDPLQQLIDRIAGRIIKSFPQDKTFHFEVMDKPTNAYFTISFKAENQSQAWRMALEMCERKDFDSRTLTKIPV